LFVIFPIGSLIPVSFGNRVKLRFVMILKVLSNRIEKLRRHSSRKISWEDISFQHDYLKGDKSPNYSVTAKLKMHRKVHFYVKCIDVVLA
jgi:hypothetical protein